MTDLTKGRALIEAATPVIYHGTPITPRAALLDVLPGRAGCVSFYRPDDVEAVEAVCPRIMFRQWGLQLLASGPASGRGMGRQTTRLDTLLSLAGAPTSARALGGDPRYSRSAKPAQRWAPGGLAFRTVVGCAAVAHGRPDPASSQTAGAIRLRSYRVGGPREERTGRLSFLLKTDRGSRARTWEGHMGRNAHDAGRQGGLRAPVQVRRQHVSSPERTPL